ncbi:UDP-Glycosyltransferase/glycogen phosphorylase [Gigaspora margarita]|uniref:UDP-Glycosyltransferase/glycogen phosphorylase n=1 Tax=Gigaspora margarita TaxID=4874 RepID=A0A8H4EJX2_GIGMA|nr:UDP-Glycosyltransferase/glycogen phosphorylase [Gigaspora margarita]
MDKIVKGKNNEFIQRELDLDKSDTPKNILIGSVLGGGSHLNPMLEIGKILMDRGYKVTLMAPGNFTATSTLYRSIPQIITDHAHEELDKISYNEYNIKNWPKEIRLVDRGYTKYLNNYLQAYKEIKPDLFFCNYFANEACFDLALKLKKPVVGFASGTIFFTSQHPIRSDPVIGCHVNMENESFYNRFICAIVQPLRLHWNFRDNLNYINARRAEIGVSKHYDFRERANTLFLTDSFFGFEVPAAWPPIHQEIGPILPDTFPSLSSDLDLFLASHARTLYIAHGTFVHTTPKNYAILLQSVLELINRNILDGVIWATVKFNESELPSTINLSTGEIIPTSNLLNNLHPHVYITKNENGELEINIETLLRSWITPESKMGFFRGNYLDVFGAAVIIAIVLISSFGYGFYKVIKLVFKKWSFKSRNSKTFPKIKNK